jgi:hypothetical protein
MLIAASAASLTLISALAGCSEVREVPVTDLRPFKPISSSCVDTAETRKEIRAHNSVLDSLKTGRKVVYADGCPESKPTS